jgi:DNA-binding transcriptional MerR regulator
MEKMLPAIPAKRYFTIGEVSELCGVKPYVLRYWEQEFTQLKPMKRRGNRRYYQHHEVLLIRRIRDLLYDQGFTISGARNRLADALSGGAAGFRWRRLCRFDRRRRCGLGPQCLRWCWVGLFGAARCDKRATNFGAGAQGSNARLHVMRRSPKGRPVPVGRAPKRRLGKPVLGAPEAV